MSALKLLFMERFEYDPGLEDFPDVYVRDPRTGVTYELEDMEDVKDGCVLSLDIERESERWHPVSDMSIANAQHWIS